MILFTMLMLVVSLSCQAWGSVVKPRFFARSHEDLPVSAWQVGIGVGTVAPWQSRAIVANLPQSDALESAYRLGAEQFHFWHGRDGAVHHFDLHSQGAFGSWRYYFLTGLPIYAEAGAGFAVISGYAKSSQPLRDGREKLGSFAANIAISTGIRWRIGQRLVINWHWLQLSRSKILMSMGAYDPEEAPYLVYKRWVEHPRWTGMGNVSIAWEI